MDELPLLSYDTLQHLLPPRDQQAHKGDFGHVLIIGGDEGYGGAVLMAAEAAARAGAGLVTLATHPCHQNIHLSRRPELMCRAIHHEGLLQPLIEKASVIVMGPGLGRSDWSRGVFTRCLETLATYQSAPQSALQSTHPATQKQQQAQDKPMLLDADALNLMSEGLGKQFFTQLNKLVITPHAGEAARLLNYDIAAIKADREQTVRDLQAYCQGVAILKGAGTLICYEHEQGLRLEHCIHGNPGMASGGMGDVLSGIIGALMAQHLSPAAATRLGVCIHALSADKVAATDGERGMLATDLMPWIRRLLNPDPSLSFNQI